MRLSGQLFYRAPALLRLAALLTIAGCSLTAETEAERDRSATIQTDRLVYTAEQIGARSGSVPARYGFELVARVVNTTTDTVFLARERTDSSEPVYLVGHSAYNGVTFGTDHDRQLAVPPGATRTDTLWVHGPQIWDGLTGEHDGRLDGRMRLTYLAQGCRGADRCRLPDSVAVSNEFEVRLE